MRFYIEKALRILRKPQPHYVFGNLKHHIHINNLIMLYFSIFCLIKYCKVWDKSVFVGSLLINFNLNKLSQVDRSSLVTSETPIKSLWNMLRIKSHTVVGSLFNYPFFSWFFKLFNFISVLLFKYLNGMHATGERPRYPYNFVLVRVYLPINFIIYLLFICVFK